MDAKQQYLLIQTCIVEKTQLILDIVKIVQEYMSDIMSNLEEFKTTFMINFTPFYENHSFVGLDNSRSLLIRREHVPTGNIQLIEKINWVITDRIISVDIEQFNLIEQNNPIKHFEITRGFYTDGDFVMDGYVVQENCIVYHNHSNSPTNTLDVKDEGLYYHDSTKGDINLFVLFRDDKNKGQYKLYVLTETLDIRGIKIIPQCDKCEPFMCEICAVGNTVYFLCRKQEYENFIMRKSVLLI